MRFCEYDKCNQPVFGTDKITKKGYCRNHQTKRTDLDRRSIIQKAMAKEKTIATKVRGIRAIEQDPEFAKQVVANNAKLQRWFEERRNELTGYCKHCNGETEKNSEKYWKYSICHILPKAYFKSVATHPSNFVELCYHQNSCHSQMDNKMLDLIDMNCFDEVVQKFVEMYPSIAPEERRRIPNVLLQYLETEM